jgi:Phasin protein
MVEQFETMQKFSRMSVERVLTTQATASKTFAAIGTETAAYAKQSFAEGKAALEQLSTVKAWDKALEIQTGYFEERPRGLRRADPQGRRALCRFREGCVQAVRRVNRLYGTEPRSPAPDRAFFVVRVPTTFSGRRRRMLSGSPGKDRSARHRERAHHESKRTDTCAEP